jgi:hypothetical protein
MDQRSGETDCEAVMTIQTKKSHMPKDSILFERIVPALLIILGIIMFALILFAAGVLLGIM